MRHIFYNTRELDKIDYIDIIDYAETLSHKIKIDKLDVENSWRRIDIDIKVADYKELILDNKHVHFTIIKRYDLMLKEYYGEVSARVSVEKRDKVYVDYFIWIYMTLENFKLLVKEFKLEENTY